MSTICSVAQTGIGTDTPNENAVLDLTSSNKGLLIPRVELTSSISPIPLTVHVAGMNVYNTATTNDVFPGFYYNNGSSWIRVGDDNKQNIYTTNGTLTGERSISQGNFPLTFNSALSSGNAVSFSGTVKSTGNLVTVNSNNNTGTLFNVSNTAPSGVGTTARIQSNSSPESGLTVLNNGNIGLGNQVPTKILDINANKDAIRIQNLAVVPGELSTKALVISSDGNIYTNNVESVPGQVLRIGVNSQRYDSITDASIKFDLNYNAATMRNAPSGAANFINTIVGASIVLNTVLPAGLGSFARTTDRILLPVGIYRITVRLVGGFEGKASSGFTFKCFLNNTEYSFAAYNAYGKSIGTFIFDDYLTITDTPQAVDFSMKTTTGAGTGAFTTAAFASPGIGRSHRSLILIERVR